MLPTKLLKGESRIAQFLQNSFEKDATDLMGSFKLRVTEYPLNNTTMILCFYVSQKHLF